MIKNNTTTITSYELLSLEEVEEMDRQRQKAIESLEISDDAKYVKCQKCDKPVAMFAKLQRTSSVFNRIVSLERHIKWAEKNSTINKKAINNNVNHLKQEPADLLKQEEKNDLLRRLPLYSSHMTGYKWICSDC